MVEGIMMLFVMSIAGVGYVTAAVLVTGGIINTIIVSIPSVLFVIMIVVGELYLLYSFVRSISDYTKNMNTKVNDSVEISTRLMKYDERETSTI